MYFITFFFFNVKLLKGQFEVDDAFGITLLAFVNSKEQFFFLVGLVRDFSFLHFLVFSCLGGW